MVYWLEHRFADHLTELELDGFVSPITNDLCRLTWQQRSIGLTLLLKYPVYETDPDLFGARFGYKITRTTLSKWSGKEVNPEAYKTALAALETAGAITIERTQAAAHIYRPGEALAICEKVQCRIEEHYPHWGRPSWLDSSDSLSTPSENLSLEVRKPEHPPQKSLDIKNLNNNQEITNTLSRISITETKTPEQPREPYSEPEPGQAASASSEASSTPQTRLSPRFAEYVEIRRARRGLDELSPMDMATARLYSDQGLDLPEEGGWRTGGAFKQDSLVQATALGSDIGENATDQAQLPGTQQEMRTALAE